MAPDGSEKIEAEKVIKAIRRGHGIIEGDLVDELKTNPAYAAALRELQVNLRNAVSLLSEELNTKDAHCILEMVQNADDNQYALGIAPSLHFQVKPMQLRIDCNELGFTEANVKAICSVGQSTKPAEGYIGEKGIGFKSCWKLANVIRVSSGPYTFMFDRNAELGMIALVLADFPPQEYLRGHTQFLLELQSSSKQQQLLKELKELPATLIMFLRRLRNLRIDLGKGASREIICEPGQQDDILRLTTKICNEAGRQQTTNVPYLMTKYEMLALANEPKRAGVINTKIVLAFPMMATGAPLQSTQNVHAFLPLRDYGFKFIIQADFLLPANREDILRCPWNLHLLSGLTVAFRQAVEKMNSIPSLRYTWFRYLSTHIQVSFLSPLPDAIKQTLLQNRVIWSWAGTLETPKTLLYIPRQFLDRHRKPLMADSSALKTYLSPNYDWVSDQTSLKSLGIEVFSSASFIRAIKALFRPSAKDWGDRSHEWHEDVAAALYSFTSLSRSSELSLLPIIPLRDGSWVSTSSSSKTIFLDHEDGVHIPTGIDIRLVDNEAAKSPARATLYKSLGIKTCNSGEVSDLILAKHRDGCRNFNSPGELLAHLVYLYQARAQRPYLEYKHLWVVSNRGKNAKAKDLYIDIPDYITAISGKEQAAWLNWLVDTIGLSSTIRLTEEGKLSRALKSVIAHHGSVSWLDLLMNSRSRVPASAYKELSEIQVTCVDGALRKLRETLLPSSDLLKTAARFNSQSLPFIKLNEPENRGWPTLLQPLGVGTSLSVGFYVRVLQHLRDQDSKDKERILDVYKALHNHGEQQIVRVEFAKQNLIFLPWPNSTKWVALSVCVWNGPGALRSRFVLSKAWSECEEFFRLTLQIKDATLETVIDEIIETAQTSSLIEFSGLKSLILAIPTVIGPGKISRLRKIKFLPVRRLHSGSDASLVSPVDKFFIADRQYLYALFTGELPLLDFSVEEIHKLSPLLDSLSVRDRRLSVLVKEEGRIVGLKTLDSTMTAKFRGKATALMRCAYHEKSQVLQENAIGVLTQLKNLEVFRVSGLITRHSICSRGYNASKDNAGDFLFQAGRPSGVEIFLPEDEATLQPVFQLHLPKEFAKFLGISKNIPLIGALLHSDAAAVEKILDYEGIPKLPTDDEPDQSEASYNLPANGSIKSQINVGASQQQKNRVATMVLPTQTQHSRATQLITQPVLPSKNVLSQPTAATLTSTRSTSTRDDGLIVPVTRASKRRSKKQGFTVIEDVAHDVQSLGLASQSPSGSGRALGSQPIATLSRDEVNRNIVSAGERFREQQQAIRLGNHEDVPDATVNLFDIAIVKPAKKKVSNPAGSQSAALASSQEPIASDLKIGITGEQFAFEYLKNAVPGFNERNWTSNLKAYTKSHVDYQEFEAFDAPEKSDFVFNDVEGHLTTFLKQNGHEQAAIWLPKPPTYYMEVKTTADHCKTPFSMSNYQANMAQTLMVPSGASDIPKAVYIVLRVFNVKSNPDLKIYVDPATLMAEGRLCSTPKDGIVVWPA